MLLSTSFHDRVVRENSELADPDLSFPLQRKPLLVLLGPEEGWQAQLLVV